MQGQQTGNLSTASKFQWYYIDFLLGSFPWGQLLAIMVGKHCTYCRSSSRLSAPHALPSCLSTASRTRCGTGCTPCACNPGSFLWAACTLGRAWCWPGSSWRSRSLRCSCASTQTPFCSPPAANQHEICHVIAVPTE